MAQKQKKPTPKTQKEISTSLVEPYNSSMGDPNFEQNRGDKISWRGDTTKPFNVGFQDMDEAIIYYFNNIIQPSVSQNGENVNVPILYGSPERWKSFQNDGYLRDGNGKIMLPLILFKSSNIEKDRTIGNKLDSNYPNNFGVFQKKYTHKDSYSNFNILNNKIPSKEYVLVVFPDYVTVIYNCVIMTYYVEQMNKIIEAINYASDSYWGDPERFKFKATIDNFSNIVETNSGEERFAKTTFEIKLKGYIIPDIIQKYITGVNTKFNSKSSVNFSVEVVEKI